MVDKKVPEILSWVLSRHRKYIGKHFYLNFRFKIHGKTIGGVMALACDVTSQNDVTVCQPVCILDLKNSKVIVD